MQGFEHLRCRPFRISLELSIIPLLNIARDPKWESDEKVSYLKEWLPAKVRKVFEVISVRKE